MLFDTGAAEQRLWYRSRDHQQDQFRAVAKFLPPGPQHLLDVGCGYGDFLHWLPDGYTYRGIDKSERCIQEARELYPGNDFEVTDVVTDADVIVSVAAIQCELVPPREFLADLVAHAPLVILTTTKKWDGGRDLFDDVAALNAEVVDSEDDWVLFVFRKDVE